MPKDKFCFVQTSPFGQSQEAQRLEQLRARAHTASVSPRRRRTSFQILHDVLGPPAQRGNALPNAYQLPTSPPSLDAQSSEKVFLVWSTTALPTSSSASPLSPLNTPEALKEEEEHNTNGNVEELSEDYYANTFGSPAVGALAVPNRVTHLIPGDHRCFRGMRTDPFHCIPARGSESVSSVVDYHAQIMAPNHAPIYKIFNVRNVYTTYYFELLQNEDFLYTGVASVQAVIDQLRSPGQKPSQNVLRHIGKAMSSLRRRLERPGATADDLTIMTVLFLAVVARAIGDMPSHEVHKKSVSHLVSSRGGLDALGHDGLAKCTLMQWESFWALNSGLTIFPEVRPAYAPIYPNHPFSEDLRWLISKLPTGLRALAEDQKLAMDVLEVLARASEAEQLQKKTGSIVTQTDIFRSQERRYHDFWEACSCLAAPDVDGPNFEKLLVLALLLYCLHTFSPVRAVTAVYNGSRMKLTNDIRKRKVGSVKEEGCLLWIWMVLVDSWRSASGMLLPTGIELMQQARERWDHVRDWAKADLILREFFWDEAFAKRCRFYWATITPNPRQ